MKSAHRFVYVCDSFFAAIYTSSPQLYLLTMVGYGEVAISLTTKELETSVGAVNGT